MTDAFMNSGQLTNLIEKTNENVECDSWILKEKIGFMSRVAVDYIYETASSYDISKKGDALISLAAHKDKRCITLIEEFCRSRNLSLINAALNAAAILKDPAIYHSVAEMLRNPAPTVRIKALETAFKLDMPNLTQILSPLTGDKIWFVRERLAKLINTTSMACELLSQLKNDSNAYVCRAANMLNKNIQTA